MLVLVLQSVSVWTMLGPTSPLRDVVRTEIWEAAVPATPPLHLSASLRRKTGGEERWGNKYCQSPVLTSPAFYSQSVLWSGCLWADLVLVLTVDWSQNSSSGLPAGPPLSSVDWRLWPGELLLSSPPGEYRQSETVRERKVKWETESSSVRHQASLSYRWHCVIGTM